MTVHPAEAPPPSPAEPDAGAESAEHRLARRRRRRSRRRYRRHMMSAAALGMIVGAAGAVVGVVGAIGFVGSREEAAAARAEAVAEADFVAACEARVSGMDCGCLWDDARPAFLSDTRDAVLTLIAQRESIPLRVQRIRTERLLGPELAKMVWEAAYYCVVR